MYGFFFDIFRKSIQSNQSKHQQVIGFLAFCGPGLFNALNGLGNVAGSGKNCRKFLVA
jgi:hypothetical protein